MSKSKPTSRIIVRGTVVYRDGVRVAEIGGGRSRDKYGHVYAQFFVRVPTKEGGYAYKVIDGHWSYFKDVVDDIKADPDNFFDLPGRMIR